MDTIPLGRSGLQVSPICLGTMTFGEAQVDEATAHRLLDHALQRGLNFIDTAEMYPVPPSAARYGDTERIIGNWLSRRPGVRSRIVLATNADDIVASCEGSLKRLQTEVIDLYQLHWPTRNVPMFGSLYFDPKQDRPVTPIDEQLRGLQRLVSSGKVRHVGLSNETPWGVAEFVRLADAAGLPRIASVQNAYSLLNRSVDNGLDELMQRCQVSLLAYSPLAFGLLSGKYDAAGFDAPTLPGRMALFASMRKQRHGRAEALAAARRYNALARDHGLTPTQMALAFCYRNWRVASTLIGITTIEQLDEDIDAWGTALSPELLAAIDRIRWEMRDPAQ
ncbi:MAG: aldo/keto reductase [Burkholderiaceae bacterium]|nr:aldo/keto reductase [Burkholderiaceae bacterium]